MQQYIIFNLSKIDIYTHTHLIEEILVPNKLAGVVSSTAAYKKWEKAAIAGVSLVADAAEHLERTIDKEVGQDKSSAG